MSPTQRQRTQATTAALIGAARELFASDGYAPTSLDAVVAKAGVTKGALYHHFAGKRELFAAVFADVQGELIEQVGRAASREEDPWAAFEAGCVAFVTACQEPGVQRIFLLDAPAALGWERIRSLESSSLELMVAGIERAIEEGRIAPRDPRQLAHMLFGGICETAMVVARASDQRHALEDAVRELRTLLRSLAA